MKNLFKLTFLLSCFALSTTMVAQQAKKAPAKKHPHQQGKTAAAPAPAATKTEAAKSDAGAPAGGTRMAITEQGVPKKSRNASSNTKAAPAATTGTTTDPVKK